MGVILRPFCILIQPFSLTALAPSMTLISVGLGGYLQIIHAQRWQHLEQIPQVTDGIRLPEYKILRRTDCHPDDEQHCGDRHKPAHLLLHDPMTDGEPPGSEQADIDKAAQIGKQHRVEAAPAHIRKQYASITASTTMPLVMIVFFFCSVINRPHFAFICSLIY